MYGRSTPIVCVAVACAAWLAAGGVAAQDQAIQVLQLTPNMYMLVGGGSNITLQVEPATRPPRIPGTYIGSYGVLMVDSGLAASAEKVEWRTSSPSAPARRCACCKRNFTSFASLAPTHKCG